MLAIAATVLRPATEQPGREARRVGGRWVSLAGEGVLPVYVLHQTVAVVLAAWVVSWPAGTGVQWLALTALTVTGTLALFAVLRQVPVARTLMGMRSPPTAEQGRRVRSGRAARRAVGSPYG